MRQQLIRVLVLAVFGSLAGGVQSELRGQTAATAGAEKFAVTVEHNVAAKMRDGVTLRADVYRPKADGKFPVLLERTPYDKSGGRDFGMRGAARGYVVVIQDTRGRYASEGYWYAFKNESNDGFDSVEWAAALPYADGKVGMFGGSYVGATQFLAASPTPPHLAGIAPNVTASNYHDGWTYQGGAFEQWFNQSWASGLSEDTLRRASDHATPPLALRNVLPLADYPMRGVPDRKSLAPYYADWLAHPNYDDYWKALSIEDHYPQIQVPVLSLAAWYDIFLGRSLRNYVLLKTKGGSPTARNGQRLLVYIGGHAGGWEDRKIGDVDFGEKAPMDGDGLTLDWYDAIFKSANSALVGGKPVRIFVMGRDEWRDEDDWPLARAKNTKYFLHSEGNAASATGNGALTPQSPTAKLSATETQDSFVYDPANPVPTIGGQLCCRGDLLKPGPLDQKEGEQRKQLLVYTTPALQQDLEVTGPVTADLYVTTSAVDTDFTAKLVDVWPNGFAQNLTEGILRMRYRDSQEKPEFAKPGNVYHISVDI